MSMPVKTRQAVTVTRARVLAMALEYRYRPPAFAFTTEVPDYPGLQGERRLDAMALGLQPSTGIELFGFEIKTDRADWLRERANPAKLASHLPLCTAFFLVTLPGVTRPDELPSNWGLLHYHETKGFLCVVRPVRQNVETLPLPFVAAFAGRLQARGLPVTNDPKSLLQEAADMKRKNEDLQRRNDDLQRQETRWAKAAGMKPGEVPGPTFFHELELVRAGGLRLLQRRLEEMVRTQEDLRTALDTVAKKADAFLASAPKDPAGTEPQEVKTYPDGSREGEPPNYVHRSYND